MFDDGQLTCEHHINNKVISQILRFKGFEQLFTLHILLILMQNLKELCQKSKVQGNFTKVCNLLIVSKKLI